MKDFFSPKTMVLLALGVVVTAFIYFGMVEYEKRDWEKHNHAQPSQIQNFQGEYSSGF